MSTRPSARRRGALALSLACLVPLLAACGTGDDTTAAETDTGDDREPLRVSAIPDQDPQELARLYGLVVEHLADELGIAVEYVPVTDYAAAVSLFRAGDLDLVWFGGLTGVQARLETPGAEVIAQRDIDEEFHSVFIANLDSGIEPFEDVEGLTVMADRRFTFGSESSTSGRLMPEFFLDQAGVGEGDFDREAGFSGSHDATIDLVEAGTFEAGVLNEQVWDARLEAGTVDESQVQVVFRTPPYNDYHWILGPAAIEEGGDDFAAAVTDALLALDLDDAEDAEVLDLFGAEAFIPASADDYAEIEQIARTLGLVQ